MQQDRAVERAEKALSSSQARRQMCSHHAELRDKELRVAEVELLRIRADAVRLPKRPRLLPAPLTAPLPAVASSASAFDSLLSIPSVRREAALVQPKPTNTKGAKITTKSANAQPPKLNNDYLQYFIDTGQRPQNFIRDSDLQDIMDKCVSVSVTCRCVCVCSSE